MPVYVTGGGGTHLEPQDYQLLSRRVGRRGGRARRPGKVTAVKTQQSEIDSPLDDLVVVGVLADGTATRLDLQITTTLSFTEGDEKWKGHYSTRLVDLPAARLHRSHPPDRDRSQPDHNQARAEHSSHCSRVRAMRPTRRSTGGALAKKGGASDDQREFQRC